MPSYILQHYTLLYFNEQFAVSSFIKYFYDQLLFCYYKIAYIKREIREQRVHISVPQSIQRFYGRVTYVYRAQKGH